MKRTLNDRIIGWMGAISRTEADSIADQCLRVERKLKLRVLALEPALAECVAGLREIDTAIHACSWHEKSNRRRALARETLARLQIPDDHLPTKGYPRDAHD